MMHADALSVYDAEKLRFIVDSAQTEPNLDLLAHSFGLGPEDSAKLNMAIKLLTQLPILTSSPYQQQMSMGSEIPPHLLPSGQNQSQTTLYIRNLPPNASEDEILLVFQNYGTIREARFQKSKDTQKFFGAVFIQYIHASAARLAQIQLNQKPWGNRTIHVDFATERTPSEDKQVSSSQASVPPSCSIYVSNLPSTVDKDMLTELFSRFGTIVATRPLTKDGNPKGIAFVDFALQESAAAAIDALDSSMFENKTIKVSYATTNGGKRKNDDGVIDQPDYKRIKSPSFSSMPPVSYIPQFGFPSASMAGPMVGTPPSYPWFGKGFY